MNQKGFTLIELGIVIAILGILSAGAYIAYMAMVNQARIDTTRQEMATIKRAIVGSGEVVAGGRYAEQGYLGDMQRVPGTLQDLVTNPNIPGFTTYNAYTHKGWNGPYITIDDATRWSGTNLMDSWNTAYTYTPNVGGDLRVFTLISSGPNTTLETATTASAAAGDDLMVRN